MARFALSIGGMVLGNLRLPGIGSVLGGALGSYVGGLVDQQRSVRSVRSRRPAPSPGRGFRISASNRPAMAA